jgi:hypothetical protein
MDPLLARKTWRTVEPIHGIVYFGRESLDVYKRLGLTKPNQGYFATRAAAMGAVPAEVVIATFFNFNPAIVRVALPSAWDVVPPAAVVEARLHGIDKLLRRLLDDETVGSPEVAEAAELARRAAEAACERPEGRPLFAGHAALPWPEDPHLVLWHAQTLLREFRGDAHVALLMMEGLTGCEALVMHAGTGEVPASVLQASRAWSDDEWTAAVGRLQEAGLVDDNGTLTESGRAARQHVEGETDRLSLPPYEALGEEGCERLRTLCRPLSQAIVGSGELGFGNRSR